FVAALAVMWPLTFLGDRQATVANRLRCTGTRSMIAGRPRRRRSPWLIARTGVGPMSCDDWWWSGGPGDESEDEILVVVPIPDAAAARDVVVDIRARLRCWRVLCGRRSRRTSLDGSSTKNVDNAASLSHSSSEMCGLITIFC
ncbi:unnamed protein product, partial [Symbiodinium pilosum]